MNITDDTGNLITTKHQDVRTIILPPTNLQETLETNVTTIEMTGTRKGIKKQP